jgi:cell division protein ZapB
MKTLSIMAAVRLGGIGQTAGRRQHVFKIPEPNIRDHHSADNTAVGGYAALCIALCPALYWHPMNEANSKSAVEQELKRLEKRLEDLIVTVSQIKEENRALRQRQDTLTSERAGLLQKNEQVRARVEAMIGRLKSMEQA